MMWSELQEISEKFLDVEGSLDGVVVDGYIAIMVDVEVITPGETLPIESNEIYEVYKYDINEIKVGDALMTLSQHRFENSYDVPDLLFYNGRWES